MSLLQRDFRPRRREPVTSRGGMGKRVAVMLSGILLMGFAVALARLADLGTDPCTTMNLGISGLLQRLGLGFMTFGTWQLIFNIALLVAVFFLDRSSVGAATFVNMVCVGYLSDFFVWAYGALSPFDRTPLWLRVVFLVIFVPLGSLACSMYMCPRLGSAPYDSVAPMMVKLSGGRLSFRLARVVSDVSAVLIGFILGATVNVGTLLMAVTSGPLMQMFSGLFDRFLYGTGERRSKDGKTECMSSE